MAFRRQGGPNDPAAGVLKDRDGRLRLAWRVVGFFGAFVALAAALAVIAPSGIQGGAAVMLSAALGSGWILLALDGLPPGALGFYLHRDGVRESFLGLLLGTAAALAATLVMAGAGGLRWSLDDGGSGGELVTVAAGALATFALPAAAEEALFRGYPLQALAEKWGKGVALLATSVAFGLLHLGNPEIDAVGTANIVLAGVFLGALYLRTGSLWWAWGAHLGWNWALGFVADVRVSGLDLVDTPFLRAGEAGPDWLSGGGFGPEGSLAATVVLAGAAALVWRGGRLEPGPGAREAGGLVLNHETEE